VNNWLANVVGDVDSLHVKIDNLNNLLMRFYFIRSIYLFFEQADGWLCATGHYITSFGYVRMPKKLRIRSSGHSKDAQRGRTPSTWPRDTRAWAYCRPPDVTTVRLHVAGWVTGLHQLNITLKKIGAIQGLFGSQSHLLCQAKFWLPQFYW
jgi:hypothetical protein